MNIFELFGRIVINSDEATEGIDDVVDTAEDAESKLDTAFSKIGRFAVSAGKAIATGLAAGTAALTALLKEALEVSGQVEQGFGGAEAVFGSFSEGIIEKSRKAYASMGVSMADYLSTANKMGSLFIGSGYSAASAYEMTTAAMQRAADVAAIMGIDLDWAMESVAGMAKGNFTMMDNLGVAINDTTLQAYAFEKGITASVSEMTTANKVALAYEMFMDRTAYAMGRYAEENLTYAGSLNTAKAALQNWLAGEMSMEEAIPYIQQYIDIMVEKITALLPGLIQGITALMDALVPYLPELLEKIVPAAVETLTAIFFGLIENLPALFNAVVAKLPSLFGLSNARELEDKEKSEIRVVKDVGEGKIVNFFVKGDYKYNEFDRALSDMKEKLSKGDQILLKYEVPDTMETKEQFAKWKKDNEKLFEGFELPVEMPDENATIEEIQSWWEQVKPTLEMTAIVSMPSMNGYIVVREENTKVSPGHRKFATGLDYVPRDNFLASLHKGEAVLTAKEASEWRKGMLGGQQVYHDETIVSGNTFVIRNEQDIYSLSAQIASMKREKRRGRGAYA